MAQTFGARDDLEPGAALLEALQVAASTAAYLGAAVSLMDAEAMSGRSELFDRWERALDRQARISAACVNAGLAERLVSVETGKAQRTAEALVSVLSELGLDRDTKQKAIQLLREKLTSN